MGNCRGKLIGGEHEETIALDCSSLATSEQQIADSHMIASEECAPSVDKVALGDRNCARLSGEQKPEYRSVRVEAMMQSRSDFSSVVAHEIEHSKAHWSELGGLGDGDEDMDEEAVMRENFEVFSELQNDPRWTHHELGSFFGKSLSAELGQMIAKGGQAEIFEYLKSNGKVSSKALWKVFEKGTRISQLRQQWPSGVLQRETAQIITGGFIITEDGRFAFLMVKCWGDLRKLIDQAMQAKNNQGPPFPFKWNGVTWHALPLMKEIASYMDHLHNTSIVHRDMKASNILLNKELAYPHVVVADYECSIGVVGTGFWRAPEILLGLKNRSAIDFSEKVDVYGYGMTCFEIVTGLLPFEGELEACRASNDLIIEGRRPTLPRDLDVRVKHLIERCWDPNPLERPAFLEIWDTLTSISVGVDIVGLTSNLVPPDI